MPGKDWDIHYQAARAPWETGHHSSELERVIKEEKIRPCRTLELGCGSGVDAVWLVREGFSVVGVDFNEIAIGKALARAVKEGVTVNFLLQDALALPDDFGVFEFVFDRGCYHSLRGDGGAEKYVRTLRKVTAPGSRILILAGNAKEPSPPGMGPPVVSEDEIRAELGSAFDIARLREFRFDDPSGASPHLAWSCLLRA